jgi:prepilin-type N-terminal cleavage/methylation domain-containing protein
MHQSSYAITMNRRAGFTLIELLITITIMVVLMVLAVFSMRALQANARDEKRKTDIESIARGLEQRYTNGNPKVTSAPNNAAKRGAYPGINEIWHAWGWDRTGWIPSQVVGGYLVELLPGTTKDTFIAPNSSGGFTVMCSFGCLPAETQSVIDTMTTTSAYVYEPIAANGDICSDGDCVRYNLYYRTEKDNVVHKVMSKHQ